MDPLALAHAITAALGWTARAARSTPGGQSSCCTPTVPMCCGRWWRQTSYPRLGSQPDEGPGRPQPLPPGGRRGARGRAPVGGIERAGIPSAALMRDSGTTSAAHAARSMLRGGDRPDEVERAVGELAQRSPTSTTCSRSSMTAASKPPAAQARGRCSTCTTTGSSALSQPPFARGATASAVADGARSLGSSTTAAGHWRSRPSMRPRSRLPAQRDRSGRRIHHTEPLCGGPPRAPRGAAGAAAGGANYIPDHEVAERSRAADGAYALAPDGCRSKRGSPTRSRPRMYAACRSRSQATARSRASCANARAVRAPWSRWPRETVQRSGACWPGQRWRSCRASPAT